MISKLIHALFAALLLPLVALATPTPEPGPGSAQEAPAERVIVLGVDGGDGRTVEELMDRGLLPNMSRLRAMGTFARLGTSIPNESPTAWAALNTGRNPAETAVPSFVRRKLVGDLPRADFGFIVPEDGKLEDFPDRPIFATRTTGSWYLIGGLGSLIFFLLVFKLLLRMRIGTAGILSLVLGGIGAFAAGTMRGYYPEEYPRYANPLEAKNFWDIAGEHGVRSVVLDSAQSFDSESPDGVDVLHGLGVPDARNGIGDWLIYTTNDSEFDRVPKGRTSSTAGRIFRVDERDGVVSSKYFGPKNFYLKEQLEAELTELEDQKNDPSLGYKESLALGKELKPRIDELKTLLGKSGAPKGERHPDLEHGIALDLKITPKDGKYEIAFGDQSQLLAPGDWSDFFELTFQLNPMVKIYGVTRCKLVSVEPHIELFINTLDIAPQAPPFWQPISAPHDFSKRLAAVTGFETYGWACTTMPFKDGEVTPDLLLEDIEFTLKWREALAFDQLERDDWRLFMSVFSTPDRVQHMMYQFYDEQHPLYDPVEANREVTFFGEQVALKDAIPAIFQQIDRIVGRVLDEHLGEDDVLLMCADHGFQTFRHQVNINNLLAELGFLGTKDKLKYSKSGLGLNDYVDWKSTRAYSMGLGFIYLNLKGREKFGTVDPADAQATLDELRAALLDWRDPATGEPVIQDVYQVDQIHGGEYIDKESDLILGFVPSYRVSWGTTGGKLDVAKDGELVVPGVVVKDNTSPWSGGHPSVAESEVRGLFFSSRPVQLPADGPNLLHIAPTVLDLLGVPIPTEMDLAPLEY